LRRRRPGRVGYGAVAVCRGPGDRRLGPIHVDGPVERSPAVEGCRQRSGGRGRAFPHAGEVQSRAPSPRRTNAGVRRRMLPTSDTNTMNMALVLAIVTLPTWTVGVVVPDTARAAPCAVSFAPAVGPGLSFHLVPPLVDLSGFSTRGFVRTRSATRPGGGSRRRAGKLGCDQRWSAPTTSRMRREGREGLRPEPTGGPPCERVLSCPRPADRDLDGGREVRNSFGRASTDAPHGVLGRRHPIWGDVVSRPSARSAERNRPAEPSDPEAQRAWGEWLVAVRADARLPARGATLTIQLRCVSGAGAVCFAKALKADNTGADDDPA